MPLETYTGHRIAPLLARAGTDFGPDAVVVRVIRVPDDNGTTTFHVTVADPETAASDANDGAVPEARAVARQRPRGGHVVAVVGPTGSGKTTTLAKLANHADAFGDARVGFLCMDTYRIGAVEQLGTYAELSRRPMEVVYSPDEVTRAMKRLADCEVILVDTPGRGPGNREELTGVATMLAQLPVGEVHLAIPAGIRPEYAAIVLAEHRSWGVTHILATKTDEWPDDDAVFELAALNGIPMRWLTNGQEVPTNLAVAASRYAHVAHRVGTPPTGVRRSA